MMIGLLQALAMMIHGLANWIQEIANTLKTWRQPSEPFSLAATIEPQFSADDAITNQALQRELYMRGVVAVSVDEGATTETLRVSTMGLCRSMSVLGQKVAEQSQHKQTCLEAATVVTVASACEQMLRSLSGLQLIRHYRFAPESEDSQA